jgi:hypothetical protein
VPRKTLCADCAEALVAKNTAAKRKNNPKLNKRPRPFDIVILFENPFTEFELTRLRFPAKFQSLSAAIVNSGTFCG